VATDIKEILSQYEKTMENASNVIFTHTRRIEDLIKTLGKSGKERLKNIKVVQDSIKPALEFSEAINDTVGSLDGLHSIIRDVEADMGDLIESQLEYLHIDLSEEIDSNSEVLEKLIANLVEQSSVINKNIDSQNKLTMSVKRSTDGSIEFNDSLSEVIHSITSVDQATKDMGKSFFKATSESKAWTAMSRILSGTGLWAIQNQIRAIVDIGFIWEKREAERLERMAKSTQVMNAFLRVQESLTKETEKFTLIIAKADASSIIEGWKKSTQFADTYNKKLKEMRGEMYYDKINEIKQQRESQLLKLKEIKRQEKIAQLVKEAAVGEIKRINKLEMWETNEKKDTAKKLKMRKLIIAKDLEVRRIQIKQQTLKGKSLKLDIDLKHSKIAIQKFMKLEMYTEKQQLKVINKIYKEKVESLKKGEGFLNKHQTRLKEIRKELSLGLLSEKKVIELKKEGKELLKRENLITSNISKVKAEIGEMDKIKLSVDMKNMEQRILESDLAETYKELLGEQVQLHIDKYNVTEENVNMLKVQAEVQDKLLKQEFAIYGVARKRGLSQQQATKELHTQLKIAKKQMDKKGKGIFGSKLRKEITGHKAKLATAGIFEKVDIYKDMFKAYKKALLMSWKGMKKALTWKKVKDGVWNMAKNIGIFLLLILGLVVFAAGVKVFLDTFGKSMKETFSLVWKWLVGSWKIMIEGLGLITSGFMDIYTGLIEGDWKKVGMGFLEILIGIGLTFLGFLGLLIGGIIGPIWAIFTGFLLDFFGQAENGWDYVKGIIGLILTVIVIVIAIKLMILLLPLAFAAAAGLAAIGLVVAVGAIIIGAALLIISGIKKWVNPFASGGVTTQGLSLVGERGPELVNLPAGSKVHSNKDSRSLTGKSIVNNITVNVKGSMGSSDAEVRVLADKIGKLISKEINRTTNSARF
jgi:hypothetical protein